MLDGQRSCKAIRADKEVAIWAKMNLTLHLDDREVDAMFEIMGEIVGVNLKQSFK